MTPLFTQTQEFITFTNHWTACAYCHPRNERYCDEGKRLHALSQSGMTLVKSASVETNNGFIPATKTQKGKAKK